MLLMQLSDEPYNLQFLMKSVCCYFHFVGVIPHGPQKKLHHSRLNPNRFLVSQCVWMTGSGLDNLLESVGWKLDVLNNLENTLQFDSCAYYLRLKANDDSH